jgi:hypothetical protein
MRKMADPHLWWLQPGGEPPYLSPYSAFQEELSPEQCRKALEKIGPAPEQRKECEKEIVMGLKFVEFAKRFERVPNSRVATKERFRKLAKKLRQAGETVNKLSNNPTAQAMSTADAYEWVADRIPVSKGGPRRNEPKKIAVYWAYRLLKRFRDHRPGMTRDGDWHELAEILYGNAVHFDYLRDQYKRNLGPQLFSS